MQFARPSSEETGAYRELPHNVEAEQSLLGAVLLDNDALDKVTGFLEPEHFSVPIHGRIYDAARTISLRGQLANPVTLKAFFDRDEALADIGGAQYLSRLAESAVSLSGAEAYGRVIYDLALRRELIRLGQDVVETAYDPEVGDSATDQIEAAEHSLFTLAESGQADRGFRTFAESVKEAIDTAQAAFKRVGQLSGVASGFADLDKLLGGLHNSDLLVVAGRPSMGKTALATNIAFHAASSHRTETQPDGTARTVDGAVVAFFSLEMSAEQLANRVLAGEAKLRSDHIRKGDLSNEEFLKLVEASRRLASVPLYIDDTPALSVAALRSRARRLKRTKGLGMVVIDYLQLLRPSRNIESRVQEISDITQGLKALAKELNVPVVALSQLSRAVENREDKRPQLSDLRESGTIEQDSDVVMFVFREEYYLQRSEPQPRAEESPDKFEQRYSKWQERLEKMNGLADIFVAKQRHGPIGNVRLTFDSETTSFHTYAAETYLPEQRS